MIAVIDYGVGNLFSLVSSLRAVGAETVVTGEPKVIETADRLILPGVGAFGDAARKLKEQGLDRIVVEQAQMGKPLLGICLGMQLLFEKSWEYGEHQGLGLIPGQVVPMEGKLPPELKIPHIGWNALDFHRECPIFQNISQGQSVYFVHSYYAEGCGDALVASTEYGISLTAAVEKENVFGCQFHPEKSGSVGLNILRGFCTMGDRL